MAVADPTEEEEAKGKAEEKAASWAEVAVEEEAEVEDLEDLEDPDLQGTKIPLCSLATCLTTLTKTRSSKYSALRDLTQ